LLEDLGLQRAEFTQAGSVQVCYKSGRLHVDASHPSQRAASGWYVDDIVAAIKQFRQQWEAPITIQNA
jgi:hypothetical protein